jgi:hypothetical protein
MCAHRLSLVQSLKGGKDHGAAIQSGDLRDLSSVRICALPGCSIGMCTLLFGYRMTFLPDAYGTTGMVLNFDTYTIL